MKDVEELIGRLERWNLDGMLAECQLDITASVAMLRSLTAEKAKGGEEPGDDDHYHEPCSCGLWNCKICRPSPAIGDVEKMIERLEFAVSRTVDPPLLDDVTDMLRSLAAEITRLQHGWDEQVRTDAAEIELLKKEITRKDEFMKRVTRVLAEINVSLDAAYSGTERLTTILETKKPN